MMRSYKRRLALQSSLELEKRESLQKQELNEERLRFFDYYMKGIDNGWKETPTVRYCLHDMEGGNKVDQPATQFPPVGTEYKKLYLNGLTR